MGHKINISKSNRYGGYLRDGMACTYCGCSVIAGAHPSVERAATHDHIVPRSTGGGDSMANLVTACRSCNSSRKDMSIMSWLRKLETKGTIESAKALRRRIYRQTRKNIDRKAGLRMAKALKAAKGAAPC